MTNLAYELIACPYCCDEVERIVFSEIDLREDEDLRERLLQKKINAYQCLNCGHEFVLARSLTVIEPKARLIIHYAANLGSSLISELKLNVNMAPNSKEALMKLKEIEQAEQARLDAGETLSREDILIDHLQGALAPALDNDAYLKLSQAMQSKLAQYNQSPTATSLRSAYPNFTYRLVLEYNDLIEKLQIANNGLKDTYLELIKLASLKSSAKQDIKSIERIFFLNKDENHLVFMVYLKEQGWDYYDLPTETYTNTELYANYLITRQDFALVDQSWAIKCFDNILEASLKEEASREAGTAAMEGVAEVDIAQAEIANKASTNKASAKEATAKAATIKKEATKASFNEVEHE